MLEKVKETVAEALGADIDTITEETSFKDDRSDCFNPVTFLIFYE